MRIFLDSSFRLYPFSRPSYIFPALPANIFVFLLFLMFGSLSTCRKRVNGAFRMMTRRRRRRVHYFFDVSFQRLLGLSATSFLSEPIHPSKGWSDGISGRGYRRKGTRLRGRSLTPKKIFIWSSEHGLGRSPKSILWWNRNMRKNFGLIPSNSGLPPNQIRRRRSNWSCWGLSCSTSPKASILEWLAIICRRHSNQHSASESDTVRIVPVMSRSASE